jgi:hypothetical protein
MGFLYKFQLIIKYKNGIINNLENILSKPPTSNITSLKNLMHMDPFTHDAYKYAYIKDEDFKEMFQQLQGQFHVEEGDDKADYYIHNGFLYKIEKHYVFQKVKYCIFFDRHATPKL